MPYKYRFKDGIKEIINEEGLQPLSSEGDHRLWQANEDLLSGSIDIKEAIEKFLKERDYGKILEEKYGRKLEEYLEKKLRK